MSWVESGPSGWAASVGVAEAEASGRFASGGAGSVTSVRPACVDTRCCGLGPGPGPGPGLVRPAGTSLGTGRHGSRRRAGRCGTGLRVVRRCTALFRPAGLRRPAGTSLGTGRRRSRRRAGRRETGLRSGRRWSAPFRPVGFRGGARRIDFRCFRAADFCAECRASDIRAGRRASAFRAGCRASAFRAGRRAPDFRAGRRAADLCAGRRATDFRAGRRRFGLFPTAAHPGLVGPGVVDGGPVFPGLADPGPVDPRPLGGALRGALRGARRAPHVTGRAGRVLVVGSLGVHRIAPSAAQLSRDPDPPLSKRRAEGSYPASPLRGQRWDAARGRAVPPSAPIRPRGLRSVAVLRHSVQQPGRRRRHGHAVDEGRGHREGRIRSGTVQWGAIRAQSPRSAARSVSPSPSKRTGTAVWTSRFVIAAP